MLQLFNSFDLPFYRGGGRQHGIKCGEAGRGSSVRPVRESCAGLFPNAETTEEKHHRTDITSTQQQRDHASQSPAFHVFTRRDIPPSCKISNIEYWTLRPKKIDSLNTRPLIKTLGEFAVTLDIFRINSHTAISSYT